MNLAPQQLELLNQLEPIMLPEPIGFWPLSTSWWMLIFMAVIILVAATWYYFEQKKRNAYRQEALQSLCLFEHLENSDLSPNQQIVEINSLLKQVALTAYPRTDVAQLTDQAWLDFLKRCSKHVKTPDNLTKSLQLAYQQPSSTPEKIEEDLQLLNSFKTYAKAWIKGHHQ